MPTASRIEAASEDPAAFVEAVRGQLLDGQPLRLQVGDDVYEASGDVALGILHLVDAVARGVHLDISEYPQELTTGQAAEILGVSRPTVVAMVDSGRIPARRLGTHRRIALPDLLAFRAQEIQTRSDAFDEMVAISSDLEMYDED